MSSKYRTPLHKLRKQIARRLHRLWPSHDLRDTCVELSHEVGKRAVVYEDPPDLPVLGRATLAKWQQEEDAAYVRRFQGNLTIDPKTGILFNGGRVIWSSTDYPRERSPIFWRHLHPTRDRHPCLISLHHLFRNNYFHFLNNIASKLMLIEQAGLAADIPLLVPAELAKQRFFRDARELGLFGNHPIIVQGRNQVIAATTVYVVKAHDCTAAAHEWICDRLHVRPDPQAAAWVYIQRGRHSPNARHFRNETELHALLAAHAVQIVDPQELSLAQQIAVFSNARVVISPHGAGLTNIIFRRMTPCTVIEMFNRSLGSPHYYLIARQHGFEYIWLNNLNEGREKNSVASSEADLDALATCLQRLGERLPGQAEALG